MVLVKLDIDGNFTLSEDIGLSFGSCVVLHSEGVPPSPFVCGMKYYWHGSGTQGRLSPTLEFKSMHITSLGTGALYLEPTEE